jgi:hypothetical protein
MMYLFLDAMRAQEMANQETATKLAELASSSATAPPQEDSQSAPVKMPKNLLQHIEILESGVKSLHSRLDEVTSLLSQDRYLTSDRTLPAAVHKDLERCEHLRPRSLATELTEAQEELARRQLTVARLQCKVTALRHAVRTLQTPPTSRSESAPDDAHHP